MRVVQTAESGPAAQFPRLPGIFSTIITKPNCFEITICVLSSFPAYDICECCQYRKKYNVYMLTTCVVVVCSGLWNLTSNPINRFYASSIIHTVAGCYRARKRGSSPYVCSLFHVLGLRSRRQFSIGQTSSVVPKCFQ